MKRLPSLAAGGLAVALLLASGGHGESRRESFRGAPMSRGYGAERSGPLPGYGYGVASPRGYGGYERPAFGPPPAYRAAPSPYRPSYPGAYRPGYPGGYRPTYPGYPTPTYRQNSLGADWREQQEEARAGVRHGEMAPLGRVIEGIGRRSAGRPLDAGIEYEGSRPVYRVRWMTAHGRRVDYIVDAATGAILSEH